MVDATLAPFIPVLHCPGEIRFRLVFRHFRRPSPAGTPARTVLHLWSERRTSYPQLPSRSSICFVAKAGLLRSGKSCFEVRTGMYQFETLGRVFGMRTGGFDKGGR